MTKLQLVETLAARCGETITRTEEFLNGFIKTVYEELANKGNVNISGFGKFEVSHRKARSGVDPRTPTIRIDLPAFDTPKFRAGQSFKDAVRRKG